MFSVKDKNVIITGANGSIGSVLFRAFDEAGAFVYGVDASTNTKDKQFCRCDLEVKSEVKKLVKSFDEVCVDVLINCAGITLEGSDERDFERTIRINLVAPFLLSRMLVPRMLRGGSIINVTSLNAHFSFPNNPGYMASKGALKQLTKSFAHDYGKRGIRVNNIVPGYIKTNMTKGSWQDKEKREMRTKRTLLNRWGNPEDLVGPAIFLASDASSYITGTDLFVDGGWSVKGL